jgi:acyl carrier protein
VNRSEAFAVVRDAAAELLAVDPRTIREDQRLRDDLDADAADLVELTHELEERFGVSIPGCQRDRLVTIGDAVNLVLTHLDRRA